MLDKGLRPSPAIADGRKEKVISVVPSRSYFRGNMVSFGTWGGRERSNVRSRSSVLFLRIKGVAPSWIVV